MTYKFREALCIADGLVVLGCGGAPEASRVEIVEPAPSVYVGWSVLPRSQEGTGTSAACSVPTDARTDGPVAHQIPLAANAALSAAVGLRTSTFQLSEASLFTHSHQPEYLYQQSSRPWRDGGSGVPSVTYQHDLFSACAGQLDHSKRNVQRYPYVGRSSALGHPETHRLERAGRNRY